MANYRELVSEILKTPALNEATAKFDSKNISIQQQHILITLDFRWEALEDGMS
jgi:hypothetical protein